MLKYLLGKFFQNLKMDKNKCPKMKSENTLCKKYTFVTIIKNYGLTTEKIILALLR